MYICTYVYVSIYTCILIYTYAYIYIYIYKDTHTYTSIYVQTSNTLYIRIISQGKHVCGYIHFIFFRDLHATETKVSRLKAPSRCDIFKNMHVHTFNSTNTYVCIFVSFQRSECNGNPKFDVERPRPAAAASSSHSGAARQVAQTRQGY